ncbi:MAG: septal ring lytic transglycosylase RlpA family protein [Acidobacteriaceae bacterium]
MLLALAAGCAHRQVAYGPPPAPAPGENPPITTTPVSPASPAKPSAAGGSDEEYVATHAPIYTQTGLASWYGPPYHNRTGANGTVYDEHHLSAAHRTLPMGSLIRVTNVRSGQTAVMRVTDRGPFVQGRVLDLSMAAAKATGVWGPGVAEVRIDVYSTPKPIDEGGRWCVQIGAFDHQRAALRLEEKLEHEYRSANVIEFQGPTGFWVRIRPEHDNRELAMDIANRLRPAEGEAWLVRLD